LVNCGKIGPIFENVYLDETRKAMSLTAQYSEFHFWRAGVGILFCAALTSSKIIAG
jgi:hypothetical protein